MINNVDISVKQKINDVRLQFELAESIHGENVKRPGMVFRLHHKNLDRV